MKRNQSVRPLLFLPLLVILAITSGRVQAAVVGSAGFSIDSIIVGPGKEPQVPGIIPALFGIPCGQNANFSFTISGKLGAGKVENVWWSVWEQDWGFGLFDDKLINDKKLRLTGDGAGNFTKTVAFTLACKPNADGVCVVTGLNGMDDAAPPAQIYVNIEDAFGVNLAGSNLLTVVCDDAKPVPEPATLTMFGLSLIGLIVVRRRHRKSQIDPSE